MLKTFKEYIAEESAEETSTTYDIPVHNVEFLKKQIEKLNKSANKLGCKPVSVVFGEPFMKEVKPAKGGIPAKYLEFRNATVTGSAPKLNGWSFVGKREPDLHSSAIFTKAVPGLNMPEEYADDHPIKCDHCQKNARRNETFIVKNEAGEHKEVGRSCLKDFLGHTNPNQYASYAESLYDLYKEFSNSESDYDGFGRTDYAIATDELLPVILREIKDTGFVPSKAEKYTTAMAVADHFFPPKGVKDPRFIYPTDDDKKEATEVISFIKNHPEAATNDFWRNVSKMISSNAVSVKHFGYISAGVAQYIKSVEKQNTSKALSDGVNEEPLGDVGTKVHFKGSVLAAFSYQGNSFAYGDSGVRYILTVKTDGGNIVKMFTSTGHGVEKGHRIEISGKVGSYGPETYATSPFVGKKITTMAPRSRILNSFNPAKESEHADGHYHIGDTVEFNHIVNNAPKLGVGQIVAKPVFGSFTVKSLKNDTTITVEYDDIIKKV